MSLKTPTMTARLANIQSLRGIAALLVVLSHLLIIEQKYSPDQILGPWAEFGWVGVDIFFVISGFIMVYVTQRSKGGAPAAIRFLSARISRIYPLYWLISAAILCVYFWQPGLVFSSQAQMPDLIKSFLLWPDNIPPLLAVGWTLIHEMGFYIIFAFSLLLPRKYLPFFLLLWAVIIGAMFFAGTAALNPVLYVLLSPLSFEFLAGAGAALIYLRSQARFAKFALCGGLLLWVAVFLVLGGGAQGMLENHGQRALYFTLPATLCVYGLAGLKTQLPKWSQILGDYSYALYLTHILTLSLLGRLWHSFASPGSSDNWAAFVVMLVVSIGVAGLVYHLFEKPVLAMTKKLNTRLFPPS